MLGIKGLRSASFPPTPEGESKYSRPSELTCIDPSLRVHSLLEVDNVTLGMTDFILNSTGSV